MYVMRLVDMILH